MAIDLRTLNPEQRAAVEQTEGPLLLLAGAGSGKTRVITMRIAWLRQRHQIPAEAILAVTFTNKAAREMRERVAALVGKDDAAAMTISTFHSLGVKILREEIERFGYKRSFSIYATADQQRLMRDLLREHGKPPGEAENVLWRISDAKNRLTPPERFTARRGDPVDALTAQFYPRYQRALKAFNAIDFDDILLLAVRLFGEHPTVLKVWRERYRYVMVDEYQDTNLAQYRLLRLLCEEHRNICVVGDDDQSIYGWRGAEPGNILDFCRDYPGGREIKLEQNYRSTGNILTAANVLIRNNQERRDKKLWSAGGSGAPVKLIRCADDEDEARTVVDALRSAKARGRCKWSDFAILYRTNAQSRAFEEELRFADIPYVLIGGQQFFDRKEVKDALAYLQVLVNPRDEVNLLRILNTPKRGIGESTAEKLIEASARSGRPLWELLREPRGVVADGDKVATAIAGFVILIETWRLRFRHPPRLADACRDYFAAIGLEDDILRTAEDVARGRRRAENIAEVVNACAAYAERDALPTLAGFLDKVSLLDHEEPGRNDKEGKLAQDAVVLMSLHASKGLEFPHVYLAGLEEDTLPHRKADGEAADLPEERRLLYVGITRARRELTLLHAEKRKKYGKLQPRLASRFLAELPTEAIEAAPSLALAAEAVVINDSVAHDFFASMRSLLGDS